MFDDRISWLVLIGLVGGGWLLGIVGFFRAARALREVAVLRAMLVQGAAAAPAPSAGVAPSP